MIVRTKLAKQMSQISLAEDHEVIEALAAYRLYEPFRVRGAVRTVCQNRHTCHTAGLEESLRRLREQRVSAVDQVSGVAQEAVHGVETKTM